MQFAQEEARAYILYRYDQGRRWQTINGDYSALQKFYKHVLQQEWRVDHLPRPRKSYPVPKPVQRLAGLRQKAYLESAQLSAESRAEKILFHLWPVGHRSTDQPALSSGGLECAKVAADWPLS